MLTNLPIFDQAAGMARFAAARQRVVAENLAHADNPGYRARDLPPFGEFVRRQQFGGAPSLPVEAPRATRPGHARQLDDAGQARGLPAPRDLDTPLSPNGNNVVIEQQTLLGAEAAGQHRLAMSVYAKGLDLMKLGLGRLR
ncbi:MAG: flagellar basal body rod protein FlgB [Pseudomonadota bacterium]